jgi:hypothetical protein
MHGMLPFKEDCLVVNAVRCGYGSKAKALKARCRCAIPMQTKIDMNAFSIEGGKTWSFTVAVANMVSPDELQFLYDR